MLIVRKAFNVRLTPPEKERALPGSDNPAGSTLPMESDETDVNDPTTS